MTFEDGGIVQVAKPLWEKAWEYLPSQAPLAQRLVQARYWLAGSGNVTISYAPPSSALRINSEEVVCEAGSGLREVSNYRDFMHYRGVELDSATARVRHYYEATDLKDPEDRRIQPYLKPAKEAAKVVPSISVEAEGRHKFYQAEFEYLLRLFDGIL